MDLISVIVPIYNAEKYVDRCIASIADQTYEHLEIILVDDGSPDNCPSICDDWAKKDNRIVVIHQRNMGVSAARNAGINRAAGKYLVQVDSDDYISRDMIKQLYHALVQNNVDLSVCDFEKGTEDNFQFGTCDDSPAEVIDGKTALERIYSSADSALRYVVPWIKLYKRELFTCIEYPEGKIFEDIYTTHQILVKCRRIAVIPQKLSYYFQHPDSIMNKKYHVGKLDYLEACKNRIEFLKEHGLDELSNIAYEEYLHSLIWEYSRARDLLADKKVMADIVERYRKSYERGYESKRYQNENRIFLWAFYINPELIAWYWKISAKLK